MAITIHKCHYLTLNKTTINIGKTKKKILKFMILARVKTLEDLQIEATFLLKDMPSSKIMHVLLSKKSAITLLVNSPWYARKYCP